MKKRIALTALFAAAVAAGANRAHSGVLMEFEHKGPKQEKPTTGSAWIEPDRVRMEMDQGTIIYRADKDVVWMLRPAEKSYIEMSKESMAQVSSQMSDAMAKMQESMKNMPPEQRAMMEKMMAGRMGAGAGAGAAAAKPEPVVVKKTGKTETINGYPCVSYDVSRGEKGERESEVWATDWKRFDLKADDFKVFEKMAEFMKSLTGPFAGNMKNGFVQKFSDTERPDAIAGVPVRTIVRTKDGDMVQEIKKISRQSLPADKFELPEGYTKQDMMSMGGKPHAKH